MQQSLLQRKDKKLHLDKRKVGSERTFKIYGSDDDDEISIRRSASTDISYENNRGLMTSKNTLVSLTQNIKRHTRNTFSGIDKSKPIRSSPAEDAEELFIVFKEQCSVGPGSECYTPEGEAEEIFEHLVTQQDVRHASASRASRHRSNTALSDNRIQGEDHLEPHSGNAKSGFLEFRNDLVKYYKSERNCSTMRLCLEGWSVEHKKILAKQESALSSSYRDTNLPVWTLERCFYAANKLELDWLGTEAAGMEMQMSASVLCAYHTIQSLRHLTSRISRAIEDLSLHMISLQDKAAILLKLKTCFPSFQDCFLELVFHLLRMARMTSIELAAMLEKDTCKADLLHNKGSSTTYDLPQHILRLLDTGISRDNNINVNLEGLHVAFKRVTVEVIPQLQDSIHFTLLQAYFPKVIDLLTFYDCKGRKASAAAWPKRRVTIMSRSNLMDEMVLRLTKAGSRLGATCFASCLVAEMILCPARFLPIQEEAREELMEYCKLVRFQKVKGGLEMNADPVWAMVIRIIKPHKDLIRRLARSYSAYLLRA